MDQTSNEFYVPGLMDLARYQLVRAEPDSDWDAFVEASPQGTIYSHSALLVATGHRLGLWYCLKGKQRVGAVALIESSDGANTVVAPHVIYGGPMFLAPPPEQNRSQVSSEEFRITSAILRDLATEYDSVAFACAPALADMRPVLWHNYGTDGPKYDLTLRYTSLLEVAATEGPFDSDPIYTACNKSRRQEIRYGHAAGVRVSQDADVEVFCDLYRATFARQDIEMDAAELAFLTRLLHGLSDAGRLRMYAARTTDRATGSVAVFATDSKRAYYLYGANNPDLRDSHCGTMVLFEAFRQLAADGVSQIDLEGINSPKRGYFKLSFGGSTTPYFQARMT